MLFSFLWWWWRSSLNGFKGDQGGMSMASQVTNLPIYVNKIMTEHRSPSKNLIKSNDEY